MKYNLVLTLHDISGKYIDELQTIFGSVDSIYDEVIISLSHVSDERYIKEFQKLNIHYKVIEKKGCADARRRVLEFALDISDGYFHCCDFDRFITWCKFFRNELLDLKSEIQDKDFVIIGRSKMAFDSHPDIWKITERISNDIASISLRIEGVDITAGSCCLSYNAARVICSESSDLMTDGEWPSIIKQHNMKLGHKKVDGLMYCHSINGPAVNKDDLNVYKDRIRLMQVITKSLFENTSF